MIKRFVGRTNKYKVAPLETQPCKGWYYMPSDLECGYWKLHEIPDSQLFPLVGFKGPLLLNTMILNKSNDDAWLNTTRDFTEEQTISIGIENQRVTLKQIRDALIKIPDEWYKESKTFWFEGIDFVESLGDRNDFHFIVHWS